jgi:hypothetical protein
LIFYFISRKKSSFSFTVNSNHNWYNIKKHRLEYFSKRCFVL